MISRRKRVILNICAIVITAFLYYVFSGCPALNVTMQYRREEKANLVGPAQILDDIPLTGSSYDRLLLADDGDGVILYLYHASGIDNGFFIYREKQGELTLLAAPTIDLYGPLYKKISLPVMLFDTHPEAVYAELDLELSSDYNDKTFQKSYHLTSDRKTEGYFLFHIEAASSYQLGAEGEALGILSQLTHPFYSSSRVKVAFPATVRLFNDKGELIVEQAMTLRSLAGEIHSM